MGLNFGQLGPYERVTFRGGQMNARDAAIHLTAERQFGATVQVIQASFTGGVQASGGTHDGGGARDTSTYGMTERQKLKWVRANKDTGVCIWLRRAVTNLWNEHCHGIDRGCKNASDAAKDQVGAFDRKEDGLIGDGMDYTYRPDPPVTFDYAEFRAKWVARRRLARVSDRIGDYKRQIRGLRRKIITAKREKDRIKAGAGLS
jgi:hypothetical protein